MRGDIAKFIESETGRSYVAGWTLVDQPLIDRFADATRDWNFIHVDPQAAIQTEYGGTIAHGFLVLSLLAPMRAEAARPAFPGLRLGVNYGLERVRWIGPVRSGRRIRAHFTVREIVPHGEDRYREEMDVTMEVEGEARAAMVATWITMYFT